MDELHDIGELHDNYPEDDFEQKDDCSDPFADNPYENPALDHRSFTVVTASPHPNPDNPKGLEQGMGKICSRPYNQIQIRFNVISYVQLPV